jgi:hypothetical protein
MKTRTEIKVSLKEGIERITMMIDDIYSDIINDNVLELKECDPRTDNDDIMHSARRLADLCYEKETIMASLNECESFYDIMEFAKSWVLMEGSEELIMGSFLGLQIEIKA